MRSDAIEILPTLSEGGGVGVYRTYLISLKGKQSKYRKRGQNCHDLKKTNVKENKFKNILQKQYSKFNVYGFDEHRLHLNKINYLKICQNYPLRQNCHNSVHEPQIEK